MITERTLVQAAHAWGAQGIPFNVVARSIDAVRNSSVFGSSLLNQSVCSAQRHALELRERCR